MNESIHAALQVLNSAVTLTTWAKTTILNGSNGTCQIIFLKTPEGDQQNFEKAPKLNSAKNVYRLKNYDFSGYITKDVSKGLSKEREKIKIKSTVIIDISIGN